MIRIPKGSLMNNLGIRCYVFGKDVRREVKPNGRSIRKPRNAADVRLRNNPSGWGRFWRIPAYAQVFINEL
ncbi:hypothetical protein SAMN05421881_10052 [Nitrosomonas halophila]|uniref:Uncharacterized protein n=1 Tax=Nitrosomonas halophila TaxID=44576 RepID=A0A1H3DEH6_9PROT|nr:hypothetical protein SAMN05421881_10052 [Nitrosomonas halophila]